MRELAPQLLHTNPILTSNRTFPGVAESRQWQIQRIPTSNK